MNLHNLNLKISEHYNIIYHMCTTMQHTAYRIIGRTLGTKYTPKPIYEHIFYPNNCLARSFNNINSHNPMYNHMQNHNIYSKNTTKSIFLFKNRNNKGL